METIKLIARDVVDNPFTWVVIGAGVVVVIVSVVFRSFFMIY